MCGFVGFIDSKIESKEAVITEMMDTIVHRGPDDGGTFCDDNIALGFRRLSILDISEVGHQPMFNEDGSIVLVFNGEIYNFQELKEDLEKKGHIFKSHSDSEVLVHGYEEYNVELLKKVRGMFAFAIWDSKEKSLLIARDFFGIKPLYFTRNTKDGSMIFGSEIKSFLKNPNFIKELNKEAVKPYLTFQYSVMDESFFKGVYKLKPAHYMIYKDGKLTTERYWDATFEEEENTLEYYKKKISDGVKESVKYHKISDVKVGCFLSGGIDSSYITASLMPDNTFTVGFEGHGDMFNETDLAKELSDILELKNHKKMISSDEFFEKLPLIQYHMDEPHANLSTIPLYFLAELASQHVTVVLSGEGADEIFGGYEWYRKSKKLESYERLPFGLRRGIKGIAEFLPHNPGTDFLVRGGQKVEEKFIGQAKIFEENEAADILTSTYKKAPSVQELTKDIFARVEDKDELTKMQYLDINLWLPGDILQKADKMSMAHSLELRVPYLDKEIMKIAGEIPEKLRVDDTQLKYALRESALEVLPDDWANRKKAGFFVPFKHWIKEEKYHKLIKDMFNEDFVSEFFDVKALHTLMDNHYNDVENNARKIYTVYTFLIWYKEYFVKA